MQKNVAGQKWTVFAFNVTTNIPVTGDAANITADIRLDGGTANPIDDTNPIEMERGYYCFDISQAESNADQLTICPVSASSNVIVIGVPGSTWTVSSLIPTTAIPPSTPSPTTDMQGFCLADLLYQILFEIGQVSGGKISNSKFPRKFIIQKLNDRLNLFVLLSQCIKKTAIIQCKAKYKQYKLPENCMDGGIIGMPKYFISANSYQSLYIRDTQWLDEQYDGWRTDAPSTPQFSYMGNSYGNTGLLGVYPAPIADGLSYTITPDLGVVTGTSIPGTNNNITGRATGGSSTSLEDTTVDFTAMGLVSGMTILNASDGSSCVIITITAMTITTSTLSGGSSNIWAAGNSYNILAGEYGVVTSWTNDDIYLFSSQVGEIDTIQVPQGNILIDFVPYPIPFPYTGNDNQYPEIPKLYHMGLAMGVVADLLSTFNEKTKEFQRAQSYEQKFVLAVKLAKDMKKSRPFNDTSVMVSPRRRGFRNK